MGRFLELVSLVCSLGKTYLFKEVLKSSCIDITDLLKEGTRGAHVAPFGLVWHPHDLIKRSHSVLDSLFFLLALTKSSDELVYDAFDLTTSVFTKFFVK